MYVPLVKDAERETRIRMEQTHPVLHVWEKRRSLFTHWRDIL